MEDRRREISGHIEILGKGRIDFQGDADEALDCILRFLANAYPAYKVVSDLMISLDIEELMRSLKGVIGISDDGLVILKTDLSTDVSIMLCLIGAFVSRKMGKMDKETLDTDHIARLSGKAAKTIRNEMPNLIKKGWVDRVERGEYRVTTAGVVQFQNQYLSMPKESVA